jgi:hypothetical protein
VSGNGTRDGVPGWVFALGFAAAMLFAMTSRYPGYVHHDTAEIVMWAGLGWPLGLPKHPPLLPWLFRAVETVLPLNRTTLDVLTAANITLGAWAVWRIARLVLDERRAEIALVLAIVSPAATFFAMKLNHNAILVSLWPLTMLAFLVCLRADTATRSAVAGVAFGMLAAAAMLAKYYSGVMLACCFAASLVSARRNQFYRMPGGYVAVLVFLALIAPHAWWMWDNRGATLTYALHESERDPYPLMRFLGVAAAYVLPVVVAYFVLRRQGDGHRMKPMQHRAELLVLTIGPYLLTAALIGAFKLRGAASWSLPDFAMLPVVLAGLLAVPHDALLPRVRRAGLAWLAIVAVAGPVVLVSTFFARDENTVEPRAEAAEAAARMWQAAVGAPPRLVGGVPQMANALALAVTPRPAAFTNFNFAFAPWVTPDRLAREGVLVLCRRSKQGGCQDVASVLGSATVVKCLLVLGRRLGPFTGPYLNFEVDLWLPGRDDRAPAAKNAICVAGGGVPVLPR